MRFPDGGLAVLTAGMAALITGGSFYQLENTGGGPMILMGHRSDNVMHIDYVTRKGFDSIVVSLDAAFNGRRHGLRRR